MSQSFTFDYFAGNARYVTDSTGKVLSFTITSPAGETYTLIQDSDSGVFAVGELVSISASSDPGPSAPGTIVGVSPSGQGLFVAYEFDDNYSYLSTDPYEVYAIGDMIPFSTTDTFPVCFVKGTLLDTPNGLVAIENLQPGDQVLGSTGMRTVKWIGWRNYGPFALRTAEQKARSTPVRISKHALADNLPSQDLLVSPWHHLHIDGVLVRANDLINGITIAQETHVTSVSYYHVELDQFDVVSAYGVYSESWADGGNRDFFQNVDVTALRPEDKQRRMADRPGFKALRDRTEIMAIQQRIAKRADELVSSLALQHAA